MERVKINSHPFGELEFKMSEGFYEKCKLVLNDGEVYVDLDIFEDFINESNQSTVEHLLNSVPNMYQTARKEMISNCKSHKVIQYFIQYHLEELDEGDLEELFSVDAITEITEEMFVNKLRLDKIILSEMVRGMECTLDFVLGNDYSDEILVANFDTNCVLINFSHES